MKYEMKPLKPQYKIRGADINKLIKYECDEYILYAYPETCFFCKYCTDIFFGSEGPYWAHCLWNRDSLSVISKLIRCEGFEEEIGNVD